MIDHLGVLCDLDAVSGDGRSASFSLAEFVVLTNGRRIVLHDDRGWGGRVAQASRDGTPPDPTLTFWTNTTVDTLVDAIRMVLIPDEIDPPDDHDWARLVALLADLDIIVTREELRALRYEVEFTDRVLANLDPADAARVPVAIVWNSVEGP